MSRTLDLVCDDCEKATWIAQGSGDRAVLYSGMPEVMEALKLFLFEHEGHRLRFIEDQLHDYSQLECKDANAPLTEVDR